MSNANHPPYRVLKPDVLPSHDRGGGARTTPLVLPSIGGTSFINGMTEIVGGAAIPFHSHNCEESVVVLSGHAYLDIGNEVHELKPFDTTFITPQIPHRFRNKSASEPLRILWIYAAASATRTLVETGETRPVSSEHAG